MLEFTTVPILQWGEFQQFLRIRFDMLGVSRSAVNRRWRLPVLAAWSKLGAAAVGLSVCLGRLPTDLGLTASEERPFAVTPTPLGLMESWGAFLLVVSAIVSLYRIRGERRRGLSPPLRWPYAACLGGLEALGAAAWTSVAWDRAAKSYIPSH